MQIHVLIHNVQQAYLAECVRELMTVPVMIMTTVEREYRLAKVPILDILDLIPKSNTLGYHPHMKALMPVMRRKYIRAPPEDISKVTERDLKVMGAEYRYVCVTRDNFDPILMSKLLVLGNVVVMDSTLPEYQYYRDCVVNNEDHVRDLRSNDLRALASRLTQAYEQLPFIVPTIPIEKYVTSCITRKPYYDPQDRLQTPLNALIDVDTEGNQHLKLSPTNGPDSLPYITLITNIHQSLSICERMLLQRSWLDNRYPTNRIEWLVITSDGQRPEWWTWAQSEAKFMTMDSKDMPTGDYVVMYQSGYYYYPHSIYARVKLMMDNPHINTVCSHMLGAYNVLGNYGYHTTSAAGEPVAATMASTTERWLRTVDVGGCYYFTMQPTREYLDGNIHHLMDFPYNYNCLRIELTREERPDKVNSAVFAKLLTFEVTGFMNKLYRVLLREENETQIMLE